MADYRMMVRLLTHAIDSVIDPLERIPGAEAYARILQNALLQSEEIYILTDESPDADAIVERERSEAEQENSGKILPFPKEPKRT